MFLRKYTYQHRSALALLLILSMLLGMTACGGTGNGRETEATLSDALIVENGAAITLAVGETLQLRTNAGEDEHLLTWSADSDAVTVSSFGFVSAKRAGSATVTVRLGEKTAVTLIRVIEPSDTSSEDTQPSLDTSSVETESSASVLSPETLPDGETRPDTETTAGDETDAVTAPLLPIETETEESETRGPIPEELGSPAGYKPAASYEEALERSARGELSGYLWLMDQEPSIDPDRPMQDGKYVRNSLAYFADDNTYVVVDSDGDEVFRVYRGGGYITLEEVAAYLYAFGDVPANYTASKKTRPSESIWGENLRVNHTKFSGSTTKYPYEPELPRISGCGGDLQYYEIDIGTTGTDCDPSYDIRPYNNGVTITRGAARIVYARFDANGNAVIEPEEKFIFYTYNHYNDFREYLNYYNGWGDMFGNITGGGTLSSKYDYNPTPYIPVILAPLGSRSSTFLESRTQQAAFKKNDASVIFSKVEPKNFLLWNSSKKQPLFWEVAFFFIMLEASEIPKPPFQRVL